MHLWARGRTPSVGNLSTSYPSGLCILAKIQITELLRYLQIFTVFNSTSVVKSLNRDLLKSTQFCKFSRVVFQQQVRFIKLHHLTPLKHQHAVII